MDDTRRLQRIEALLSRTVDRGASPHEAHTAATIAERLAREAGFGQLVARARVQARKAEAAIERAAA